MPVTRPALARRIVAGASLAIALTAVVALPMPVAAAPGDCAVRDVTSRQDFADVQSAVAAAKDGHTLEVRGLCLGPVTIDRDLAIVGRVADGVRPGIFGQESVRVLHVLPDITVSVRNLEIGYGFMEGDPTVPTSWGGGILNEGGLRLTDVEVHENDASLGAGIANLGTMRIEGRSRVHHNRASQDGGGIISQGTTTLADTAAVSENTAKGYGGGIVQYSDGVSFGRVTLVDASVVRNNSAVNGSGIATGPGTILLRDSASVRDNTSSGEAGGVFMQGGRLTLAGRASIRGNVGDAAGGVFVRFSPIDAAGSRVTLKGSSVIRANKGDAGGIFLDGGSLTMTGTSSIRGHKAAGTHAAVAIAGSKDRAGTFTMKGDSRVTGNTLNPDGAAVWRIVCPGLETPTFVGVKPRVKGNTPKNIANVCP